MKIESNLKKEYMKSIREELMKDLGLDNILSTPNIEKIVVNSGVGEAKNSPELIDNMVDDIKVITGQAPIVTKSRKSVSNFKIREGMPIGVKVTLRGEKMWAFLEKLIHIVLPRVKDFRGVSTKAFDGNGNYSLGFKEQLVFPEIDTTKVTKPHGLQVIICTTTNSDEHAKKLLEKFNFPFAK